MNVPNILTVSRIILTIFFILAMQVPTLSGACTAIVLFLVACVTDFADGYIARKFALITTFGKIMDPIADKFLTLSALLLLSFHGVIFPGFALLVTIREVLVTVARIYALKAGMVLPAETAGKVKTVFQMSAITLALTVTCARSWLPTVSWSVKFHFPLAVLVNGVMMIAVILTLWSGINFFTGLRIKEQGSRGQL